MSLPAPRAIIFDWDNTLVDTWPIIHDALNATFRDVGLPLWTMQQTQARVRKSMRDSFPEVFGPDWQKAGELYQQHYRAHHLHRLTALPQSRELLDLVKGLGLFNTVVSNKKGVNLRQEVEHIGWAPLFDKVVGAQDAARDKPFCEPVMMAFENAPLSPGPDVWFFGDSEIDLECAKNTGCTAILYGPLAQEHPDFNATHYQGFEYHAYVASHEDSMQLLRQALGQ